MNVNSVRHSAHGYELANSILGVKGPDLLIGGIRVGAVAAQFGTPLFIYDAEAMRRSYRALAKALSGFASIHFSVKANPRPDIIRVFVEEGAGVEIASIGEYRAAIKAGAAPDTILFAGPGKRLAELQEVLEGGIGEIHIESFEEIERLKSLGDPVRCSLRVNPVSSVQAGAMRMGGKPTAFGFDEENLEPVINAILAVSNIELVGVHVYIGTQILDEVVLIKQWRHAIDLASRVARMSGTPLKTIDFGGGLGIPYYAGDKWLDLDVIAAAVPSLVSAMKADPFLAEARAIVEPGRYLVGPAGIYVASIVATKESRGTRFLVTDGGMHHHLAASGNLGQVIKRSYPVVAPARMDSAAVLPVSVAGPLCTPLDVIARDVALPQLEADDIIAVLQSGAYGLTASPIHFLSNPQPAEVIVDRGSIRAIVVDQRL